MVIYEIRGETNDIVIKDGKESVIRFRPLQRTLDEEAALAFAERWASLLRGREIEVYEITVTSEGIAEKFIAGMRKYRYGERGGA